MKSLNVRMLNVECQMLNVKKLNVRMLNVEC